MRPGSPLSLIAALLVGCGHEPVELLDHDAWEARGEVDPFTGSDCSGLALSMEDGAAEISTEGCDPVTVGQTLHTPIKAGWELEIVWWHGVLVDTEPGEGTFQLFLDDALLYEAVRPIPSPALVVTETFEAPVGGSDLVWRVENHGANTWDLLRLTRL